MQINLSQQDIRKIILTSPGVGNLIGDMENFKGTFAFIPKDGHVSVLITTEPVDTKEEAKTQATEKVSKPVVETTKQQKAQPVVEKEVPETKPVSKGGLFGKKTEPVIEDTEMPEVADTAFDVGEGSLGAEELQTEALEHTDPVIEKEEPALQTTEDKPVRKSLFAGINKAK